ncbi:hypothetical protein HYT18_02010 [Candidatus Microgenomates bacterium]|nr:hypothetical protein [Candidatus Microgenomates bacterium]
MIKVFRKLNLDKDELGALSKFMVDVAKGILGAPLIIYLVSGFSLLVLLIIFLIDLAVVTLFLIGALQIHRVAKRRSHG